MEGYAKLANLMGNSHTDGHFLIFQKFEDLSAQNLLYLQAEIMNLKESLDQSTRDDSTDPERQIFQKDWEPLANPGDNEQWNTWLKLRCALKKYCKQKKALKQYKNAEMSKTRQSLNIR